MKPRLLAPLILVLAATGLAAPGLACATLPEPAGGDQNLPSAVAGPFSALTTDQFSTSLSITAPNGFADLNDFGRDISVLDTDGDPTTPGVTGYVAASTIEDGMDPTPTSPTRTIVRYTALDGRSFNLQSAAVVLQPDAPWEGDVVAAPSVLRSGSGLLLYYAAQGGIGLAQSGDGLTFTKVSGPVLSPSASGWDQSAVPASPGVVKLTDGSFRMFYEVPFGAGGAAIGEAGSPDGVTWTRLGDGPALAPSPGGDAGPTPWDSAAAGSPYPMLAVSGDGRPILRLFYGALDVGGLRTIALAARYGTDGPFERAVTPVFGDDSTLGAREPCVVAFSSYSLLYVTQDSSTTNTQPAVAVGVAPATATLPPPMPP
jgi:hypothetical protein